MPSVVSNDASVDGQFIPVTGHLFPQDVAAVFEVERARVPHAAGIDRRDAAAQHLRAEPDAPRVGRQLHVHARAWPGRQARGLGPHVSPFVVQRANR